MATKLAESPKVYEAIAAVQGELAKTGIAKTRRNTQGSGYQFRGIDDVYGALAPLLAHHGLCVIPRILEREVVERSSKNGGALFFVTVRAEFDFVAVADGSTHTCATYGEAMDSGDKATNKAMSAAYKYAAFMTFAIPTEGDNDADASTHEVAPANDAHTDEPPAREKLEGKHASKSSLKAALKACHEKVTKAVSTREVDAIVKEYAADLEQGTRYLPKWMDGDPALDGAKGLVRTISEKRDLLWLIEGLKANDTAKLRDSWFTANEAEIDKLDDIARQEFDAAFEEHDAGLKQVAKVTAG